MVDYLFKTMSCCAINQKAQKLQLEKSQADEMNEWLFGVCIVVGQIHNIYFLYEGSTKREELNRKMKSVTQKKYSGI